MVLRGAMICNITIVHHQSSFSWHSEAHWGGFSTFFCFMSLVSIKSSSIGTNELASHCTNKQKAAVRKSLFWANWLSVLELVYFWKIFSVAFVSCLACTSYVHSLSFVYWCVLLLILLNFTG
jgi:hypothetical protein